MAQRRMFSKHITDSDAFLDMPATTQNLYFHLNMSADDDGFVNAPNRIMRNIGASKNDMDLLLVKRFILLFENGVMVIRHWRIHNYVRGDRYKPTVYMEQKKLLQVAENNEYSLGIPDAIPVVDPGKVRLGKASLGKASLGEERQGEELPATTAAPGRLKEIVKVYEQEIGSITPIVSEEIELFLEELSEDLITKAIQEASLHNAKSWKYVSSILNRCIKEGLKSREDFEKRKSRSKAKEEKSILKDKYKDIYMN